MRLTLDTQIDVYGPGMLGEMWKLNGGWQPEDSCGRSRRQITSYYQAAHPAVSVIDDVSSVPWSRREHRGDEGGAKRPTFKLLIGDNCSNSMDF